MDLFRRKKLLPLENEKKVNVNCEAADILYVGAVLVYSGWSLAFPCIVTESEQEGNFYRGQTLKKKKKDSCTSFLQF